MYVQESDDDEANLVPVDENNFQGRDDSDTDSEESESGASSIAADEDVMRGSAVELKKADGKGVEYGVVIGIRDGRADIFIPNSMPLSADKTWGRIESMSDGDLKTVPPMKSTEAIVCRFCKQSAPDEELVMCDVPFCMGAEHLNCSDRLKGKMPEGDFYCDFCQSIKDDLEPDFESFSLDPAQLEMAS